LEKLLHGRSRKIKGDIHVEEKRILYFLLNELFSLISSHFRHDIQDAASRCLGEVALDLNSLDFIVMDITSSSNNLVCTSDDFALNPLLQIQISAVELLAKLIQSDDVETAIVAKDTLKAILMTEDGIQCCREIECLDLKRLISPLARKKGHKGHRSDIPEITDAFYTSILSATDKSKDSIQDDHNWCWSDKLWTCEEGGEVSFADWIKKVVCALLLCCYKDPKAIPSTTERLQASATIEGSSNFFRLCAKICSREHRFAIMLFPGIIYDLLASDNCDDSNIEKERRDEKHNVLIEVAIGAPFSLANQRLTHCFTNLLGEKNQDHIDTGFIRSHEQAVSIIVSVLDKLRLITEQRFYRFPHKRNLLTLPGRKYPEQVIPGARRPPKISEENYNELTPSPSWGVDLTELCCI